MSRFPSSPPRGQTLLLMALTLIVLTVMVLTTLNLGSRIKGRLEMQTIADSNAYSNAVVTARSFNAVSLMNRASVAMLGSMAGAAAYLSYGTQGIAFNEALQDAVANSVCHDPDGEGCCDDYGARKAAAVAALAASHTARMTQFDALDAQANQHVAINRGRAANLKAASTSIFSDMEDHLAGGAPPNELSSQLRDAAHLDEAKVAPIQWVDTREVNRRETIGTANPENLQKNEGGDALTNGGYGLVVLDATLGTRDNWLINHNAAPHPEDIATCARFGITCSGSAEGAGYFSDGRHGGGYAFRSQNVYGDHHGTATASGTVVPTCYVTSGSAAAEALYQATDDVIPDGLHTWTPDKTSGHANQKNEHTVGGCDVCPSVWVRPFGFVPDNVASRGNNLGGQPKNYAALRKDLAADSSNPWNMVFKIRMPDDKVGRYSLKAAGGEGLRYQHALGTGVTYYHRPQTWAEPANLLNPFWRATLSHGAVDRLSINDLNGVFSGPGSEAWDALEKLRDAKHAALRRP